MREVFVAYRNTRADGTPAPEGEAARALYDALNAKNIRSSFSNEGLLKRGETAFVAAMGAQIARADFIVLVLCGADSLEGGWPSVEWDLFCEMEQAGQKEKGRRLALLCGEDARAALPADPGRVFADIGALTAYIENPPAQDEALGKSRGAEDAQKEAARTFEQDGLLFCAADGCARVLGAVEDAGTLKIPAEAGGLPVTAIGAGAFRGRAQLSRVSLPAGIAEIGDYAFSGCAALEGMGFPDGLARIGNEAFSGCAAFKSAYLPYSVTSVGCKAFDGTPFLEDRREDFVVVADGVLIRYRGEETSVTLPGDVRYVCAAFYGNARVTDVIAPRQVRQIDDWAFAFCKSLRWISLADGLCRIGCFSFCGCEALETLTLPATVACLDSFAFQNCARLYQVNAPGGLVHVGERAFDGCPNVRLRCPQGSALARHAKDNGLTCYP